MGRAIRRACGIQRAALVQILRVGAHSQTNAELTVHWNCRIARLDAQRGLLWSGEGNDCHGPFDLIIAADGAGSAVRGLCRQIQCRRHDYASAAIVCLAPLPDALECCVLTQHFSAASHVSVWPVGFSPVVANVDGAPRYVAIAMPVPTQELVQLTSNPGEWLARLRQIQPALAGELAVLPALPKLLSYRYSDVQCAQYFHERVVLIGDAAHAMSPQLGLGASLSLLDAQCLARCIHGANVRHTNVAQALTHFDQLRRPQATTLRRISRIATPFFQSSNALISALREPAVRALAVFGLVK